MGYTNSDSEDDILHEYDETSGFMASTSISNTNTTGASTPNFPGINV